VATSGKKVDERAGNGHRKATERAGGEKVEDRAGKPKTRAAKRPASDVELSEDFDDGEEIVDVECLPRREAKKHADTSRYKKTGDQPVVSLTDISKRASSTPKSGVNAGPTASSGAAATTSRMLERAANMETVFQAVVEAVSSDVSTNAGSASDEEVAVTQESSGVVEVAAILEAGKKVETTVTGSTRTVKTTYREPPTVTARLDILRPAILELVTSPYYGRFLQNKFVAGPCKTCADRILRNVAGLAPRRPEEH
jgi:hypothetical protein